MHYIQKQIIDLKLKNRSKARSIQDSIDHIFKTQLLPQIETLFDQLAEEDVVYQIDRLEIDLGKFTTKSFEQKLPQVFSEALHQSLKEVLKEKGKDADTTAWDNTSLQKVSLNESKVSQVQLQQIIDFMTTGLPPEKGSFYQKQSIKELFENVMSTEAELLLFWWKKNQNDKAVEKRLISQYELKSLEQLFKPTLKKLQRKHFDIISTHLGKIVKIHFSKNLTKDILDSINKQWLIKLSKQENLTKGLFNDLIKIINHELAAVSPVHPTTEVESLKKEDQLSVNLPTPTTSTPLTVEQLQTILKKVVGTNEFNTLFNSENIDQDDTPPITPIEEDQKNTITGTRKESDHTLKKSTANEEKDRAPFSEEKVSEKEQSIKKAIDKIRTAKRKKIDQILSEGIYIENVGWIAVAPFLPTLFERLEMIKANKYVSPQLQERAVLITHYIATKKCEVPEHELFLPKIICGWPIEESLPTKIELTSTELSEIAQMTQSIIDYWKAIGKVSHEGLIDGFFSRSGKIKEQGQLYFLQVERKAIDVLLEKIPWSFSMIKFPWMEKGIKVEW